MLRKTSRSSRTLRISMALFWLVEVGVMKRLVLAQIAQDSLCS